MLVVGYKLTNTRTGESLQVLDLPSREVAKEVASHWRAKGADVLHLGTHVEVHTKN